MNRFIAAVALLLILGMVGWVWWPTLLPPVPTPENQTQEPRPELRFGHNMPQESAMGMAAERFAAGVLLATDGALPVMVFPEGKLGNDLEMAELARNGELDVVLIPTAKMSVPIPALQYADLPFYFSAPEVLYRLLDGEPGKLLLARLQAMDLVGITFWGNGFKQFTANRPIHGPEDLLNLKVRVMKSRLIMDQFTNLGARPIPIEFRETRQALADKVVDAQENPLAAIVAMGIHQVQSHLTLSHHAYLAYVLAISKKSFGKLSDKQQALILETGRGLSAFQREETVRQEEQFLRKIEDAGVKVNRLTEKERQKFARQLQHIPSQFEDVIGSDIMSKSDELQYIWQSPAEKKQKIWVGLDTELSQTPPGAGLAIKQGMILAMEEINEAGGVLGRPLALLARDNMAIPGRGEDNFRFLAGQEHVVAIVAGMHSTVVIPQSELADALKIPLLVPWAAAAGVVEHAEHRPEYVFRLSANDRLVGPFLVDAALERGSRVALILENTAWGRGILPYLQNRLQERGVNPVLVDWLNRGETELTSHLDALQTQDADVAVLVVNTNEGMQWVRSLVARKMSLPIISHWGITGGDFFGKTRDVLDKVDLSFLQTFSLQKGAVKHMLGLQNMYQNLFGQRMQDILLPHSGIAHAYDLVHLLARAIQKAGSTERASVRQALERVDTYAGLIKTYQTPFSADSHDALQREDYFLARYDGNGHIVPLATGRSP
ncbi:MAG: DctP family TRAP transporter solute-binding subunit [Magnetococcales bacterium]|nr:DctP family TRAP transporter solute-binding subunit [Magnetococcales bacterium]